MEVVQIVSQLGSALLKFKIMYDQHVSNKHEIKELRSFIEDYDHQIPTLQHRFKAGGGNVMGIAAFKTLERDIMEALSTLERWSRDKSFFRVFNSAQRMENLGKLHTKVMASVQKSLGIANLSMLLDVQASQATILESTQVSQATILESTAELKSLLIRSIDSKRGTLPMEVRDEVVEAGNSSFADPKFWEDILAAVDTHNGRFSSLEERNVYEDPITSQLMIDPVVASDGNTYCRWTIIDNNLTTNPFNVNEDLTIVIDNLTFRRGLFERFPEQSQVFRQRRDEYRHHALSLQARGLLGDAVLALGYVLQWSKRDVECVKAFEEVQRALEDAKEKLLQPCVGPSAQQDFEGLIGPKIKEMVDGTPTTQATCHSYLLRLWSPVLSTQRTALEDILEWSRKDDVFRSLIVKEGVIPVLLQLIHSSLHEYIIPILENLSLNIDNFLEMKAALQPVLEILTEGSTETRQQAATILFHLSSQDALYIGRCPGAMRALVRSLGDETHLRLLKIVMRTLSRLFVEDENKLRALTAGVISVLLRLIDVQRETVLEEALPLVESLVDDWLGRCFLEMQAPASTWLEIMASDSQLSREKAASILCTLCRKSFAYRLEAVASGAHEIILQSGPFPNTSTLQCVLNWAPDPPDAELQPCVGLSNEQIDSLLLELSSYYPWKQLSALESIREWSARDDAFCKHIISKGFLPLLLPLIQSSFGDDVASILVNFPLEIFNFYEMQAALGPIVSTLTEGSTQAREQAATILSHLSSVDALYIGKYSGAMRALVRSLGDGTHLPLTKTVTRTLIKLCTECGHEMEAIAAGVVPALLRLIGEQPEAVLEDSLVLVERLVGHSLGLLSFRMQAPASMWLEIIASESPYCRELAASVLHALCSEGPEDFDPEYCKRARANGAYEIILQFAPFPKSALLLQLLSANRSSS